MEIFRSAISHCAEFANDRFGRRGLFGTANAGRAHVSAVRNLLCRHLCHVAGVHRLATRQAFWYHQQSRCRAAICMTSPNSHCGRSVSFVNLLVTAIQSNSDGLGVCNPHHTVALFLLHNSSASGFLVHSRTAFHCSIKLPK